MSNQKELREHILKKIVDLQNKISTNEDVPHGKQNIELLADIDDKLEECLSNWYY